MLLTGIVSLESSPPFEPFAHTLAVKSEGGVDCTRGSDDMHGNMFDMAKVEDVHGWPIMNARANGQLAM